MTVVLPGNEVKKSGLLNILVLRPSNSHNLVVRFQDSNHSLARFNFGISQFFHNKYNLSQVRPNIKIYSIYIYYIYNYRNMKTLSLSRRVLYNHGAL